MNQQLKINCVSCWFLLPEIGNMKPVEIAESSESKANIVFKSSEIKSSGQEILIQKIFI